MIWAEGDRCYVRGHEGVIDSACETGAWVRVTSSDSENFIFAKLDEIRQPGTMPPASAVDAVFLECGRALKSAPVPVELGLFESITPENKPAPVAAPANRTASGIAVVQATNGQYLVQRVRDNGTTVAGVYYTRAELSELIEAAQEALQ